MSNRLDFNKTITLEDLSLTLDELRKEAPAYLEQHDPTFMAMIETLSDLVFVYAVKHVYGIGHETSEAIDILKARAASRKAMAAQPKH